MSIEHWFTSNIRLKIVMTFQRESTTPKFLKTFQWIIFQSAELDICYTRYSIEPGSTRYFHKLYIKNHINHQFMIRNRNFETNSLSFYSQSIIWFWINVDILTEPINSHFNEIKLQILMFWFDSTNMNACCTKLISPHEWTWKRPKYTQTHTSPLIWFVQLFVLAFIIWWRHITWFSVMWSETVSLNCRHNFNTRITYGFFFWNWQLILQFLQAKNFILLTFFNWFYNFCLQLY